MIEILNLQALAMQAAGDTQQAVNALEQSLNLAEPKRFLYTYINEGPSMGRLLLDALSRNVSREYVQKLLNNFPVEQLEKNQQQQMKSLGSQLIEPLTDRELDVLRLIAAGLSRQEIASELFVSINTIKTHARNIYQKLGVNSQMQAVSKARNLGLLRNT